MSTLRNAPDIEPLSEMSWRRIERAVFDELDQMPHQVTQAQRVPGSVPEPRRLRWWRPAFAFTAAVAVAAVALLTFLRHDGNGPVPTFIESGFSPVEIKVGRATLDVAPHSTLRVSNDIAQRPMVLLERGSVTCSVFPDPQQPPFTVEAGDVRIEVIGTVFSVSREGERVQVQVSKGVVHVFHDGERSVVRANETWPAATPPASSLGTARTTPPSTSTDTSTSAEHEPKAGRQGEDKQQYERAASLEATNPDEAVAIYRELARGKGPWASNALYAHARLELDRGNHASARMLLQSYLREYPHGANAGDAKALLERVKRPR